MTTATIRELNDAFRRTFKGGKVMLTPGIVALPDHEHHRVLQQVQEFAAFNGDNDPHGEHDFGSFEYHDHRYFWKIDYYDAAMEHGSENPADPQQTSRLLTIMLAEEY